jgi:hypothetical protein
MTDRLTSRTRSDSWTALPATLAGVCVVATYSVVRYRWWIVIVYLLAAVALATHQIRTPRRIPDRQALALALGLAGLATLTVPAFSYLSQPDRQAIRLLLGSAALLAAALCASRWQRGPDLALGVALAGYLAAATTLIRLDPTPKIDVWVILQQAADGLLNGQNMYTQEWVDSPGVQDAFTYLPGTAVLLAPGRWLAGDVRWMLVLVTVVAVLALRLGAGRGPAAAAVGATLLLLPGTATQVEQAWTEPLLLACLAGWALAVRHRRTGPAILMLALGLASKQHLALLLPVLAVWTSFGWRRTLGSAGLAGVLVLPWFVASPSAFWHDTVTLLVNFQPLVFADTLFIAVLNETGRTPPFWLTGAVVLGTLAAICLVVRRRQPPLGELVRWLALLLFVANLVNKQAFYNQYWLVAALVLLSWAFPDPAAGQVTADRPADRPAAAAT